MNDDRVISSDFDAVVDQLGAKEAAAIYREATEYARQHRGCVVRVEIGVIPLDDGCGLDCAYIHAPDCTTGGL